MVITLLLNFIFYIGIESLQQTLISWSLYFVTQNCGPKIFQTMNSVVQWLICIKGVIQGKLIAVVFTLRTHWNQFSLGGICKQE